MPLSSSGAREELQCDVTLDAAAAGWTSTFNCMRVFLRGRDGGAAERQCGGWVDLAGRPPPPAPPFPVLACVHFLAAPPSQEAKGSKKKKKNVKLLRV